MSISNFCLLWNIFHFRKIMRTQLAILAWILYSSFAKIVRKCKDQLSVLWVKTLLSKAGQQTRVRFRFFFCNGGKKLCRCLATGIGPSRPTSLMWPATTTSCIPEHTNMLTKRDSSIQIIPAPALKQPPCFSLVPFHQTTCPSGQYGSH